MELYATGGKGHRPTCVVLLVLFASFILEFVSSSPAIFGNSISDECDWFGSGLEDIPNINVGVQPVYLRCREGVVVWQYPRGALRVILRLGQSNRDFQGCLKVLSLSSGATLYQEEPQHLKHLYGIAEESKGQSQQMCFKSDGGQVALFLEARGPYNALKKKSFRFMYDLEPVKQKMHSECRPCTSRQLLYLYCSSDFVARGFITSLYQNEFIQQTEMTIYSHTVLRDSGHRVFNRTTMPKNNETYYTGVVHRPLHCGTQVGSGEFLLIGRWKLGMPILTCAPRWSEWKKIRQKAIESENLDCILE